MQYVLLSIVTWHMFSHVFNFSDEIINLESRIDYAVSEAKS